ncbi:MAG: bifunctional riboflavin kinase/FAD synthetase, partial [Maribacter sp.]|nr:bifunctional riboflavin kinase/FAD synthetase [Maribacter sp.]
QSISKFDKEHSTVITIGTFDGVHIGHRKILERLIKNARELHLKSLVLTFFPHPRMVLQKDTEIKLLNTLGEKTKILEKLGLDYLIVHPFTKEFSRLSAAQFVRDNLVNGLKMKKIILGYDHRFGRNRNANIQDLKVFGTTFNFVVEEIPAQEIDSVSVSSTKIRHALEEGKIKTANKYLGYRYMLTGTVKKGKGLGRKIQFPTANLHIEENYKLIPKTGVYVVQCMLSGQTVYGMMNIGYNPTVEEAPLEVGAKKESIEIHFFNFNDDLYGQELQIDIIDRLRDEYKFDSIGELQKQLQSDKENSLARLSL